MSQVARAAQHPVVRAALEEAGWHPSYSFDTSEWAEALEAGGIHLVGSALSAMRSVGGLTVDPPRRNAAAFGSGQIIFDPIWAATDEADTVNRRSAELGLHVTPIGEWMGIYMLLVAEDGSVFADAGFHLLRVGGDFCAALRRMILADSRPELVSGYG